MASGGIRKGCRSKIKGAGRQEKKYKNKSESFEFKMEVIIYYEQHTMSQTINRFYGDINKSTKVYESMRRKIQRWKKDKDHIGTMASKHKTKTLLRYRKPGVGTTLSAEQENVIIQWINGLRKHGVPVSSTMLRLYAVDVAASEGITQGFTATSTWIKSFLTRHQLSLRARTRQGQVTPEDAEKTLQEFSARIRDLVVKHNITEVYNADQTAIFYEYLPATTIDKRGAKTVWVKCAGKEKDRLTAMLLGDNLGNKFPPFAVVKTNPSTIPATRAENEKLRHGFGRQVWKEVEGIQKETGMVVYGNRAGWWNAKLSIAFIQHHFGERNQYDDPILLLWDDLGAHWTDEVTAFARSKRILLEKVPPCFTFCCQPADIAWNKPLKDHLRVSWKTFLHEQIRAMTNASDQQEKLKVEAPTRSRGYIWHGSNYRKN